jgi:hypothetical protein
MKKFISTGVLFVYAIIFLSARTHAQGCSDAGVCTLNSIKDNTHGAAENKANNITIGFSYGKGERKTNDYTPYIEYTRNLSSSTSVTGKISFAAVTGELANTSGLGDLFVSVNHGFDTKKSWSKILVAGLKIPFDEANITKNSFHLPMPYQTSLGTTDLILGIGFIHRSLGITVAVQQPLKQTNGNEFLPSQDPSDMLAAKYLPTNKFGRKGDVLLRVSYHFDLGKKFFVRPSLLGIYHEANDTYADDAGIRREIALSKGLTLNANVFFGLKLNKTSDLELSLAAPFVVREARPDGLTRSAVAALEYKFRF